MDEIENLQESRAATVIGVTAFVLTVATAAVTARVYTRAVLIKTFGADDWMAIFALVSSCFLYPFAACAHEFMRHVSTSPHVLTVILHR